MEMVECGAACLGIILGYHKRFVPLEELRIACGVSRDGSKASNILRAARGYGLIAKGYRKDLAELADVPLPAILFWNFNHFVVLEGFGRKGQVYLNDPSRGPTVVTLQEFSESYTGVLLAFEPGEDFEPGGEPRTVVQALRKRAAGAKAALAFAIAAGILLIIPGLAIPTFAQIFVDQILVRNFDSWIKPLILGMIVTALLRGTLTWIREYYLLRLDTKLAVTSSAKFLWYILRLPIEFYAQRYGGEISYRVGLNDEVASFLSGKLAARVIDAMMVVFYAIVMFGYDVPLTMVGITAVALNLAASRYVNRMRVDANRRLQKDAGQIMGVTMGGLATIETLKATGGENDFFARWAGSEAKLLNTKQELGVQTETFLSVPPLLTAIANAAILGYGGFRVMRGDLTLGMLVAFQSLMTSFLTPVNNLVGLASDLQDVEGKIGRLDDVMRYQLDPQIENAPDALPMSIFPTGKLDGYADLNDVVFGYSRLEPPLIDGFSLAVKPGARVALVGASGSGKSTVAKLLTGLYRPWAGEVLLDGQPRTKLPREILTNSVALVDQDISMMAGTVRENLTLWDPTIPESVVIRACKDACIHDDITARKGGYDSFVEEGGTNFSGGQRQRLEIARALVNNPRLLVMDEATSALDSVTEQTIDRNLRARGCTCVIIAHRLSTVRDADEIIVLDQGRVVQRGSHEQLLRDPEGSYAMLVKE